MLKYFWERTFFNLIQRTQTIEFWIDFLHDNTDIKNISDVARKIFKNTHRKDTPSNETQALMKSMNIDISVIVTLSQLFIRHSRICFCSAFLYWNVAISLALLSLKKRTPVFKFKFFWKLVFKLNYSKRSKSPVTAKS